MRVGIRVDASLEMGTGHLRRCMSLAAALIDKGADIRFVVRRHDAVGEVALGSQPFSVVWLDPPLRGSVPEARPSEASPYQHWSGAGWAEDASDTVEALRGLEPDWVIVDHYALDGRWHDQVRQGLGCRLMAIDDLADRVLAVDVVLDANLAEDYGRKYQGRLERKTRILGGPRFAILSQAYRSATPYRFHPQVRSIGVFMGGTDPGGVSARVLKACREDAGFDGLIEVVSTSANPRLEALRAACAADPDARLLLDLPDLSAFYARHDLQIGGGGTASYERCRMGAPSIALVLAPNQLAVIPMLAATGTVRPARLGDDAGEAALASAPDLVDVIRELVADPDARLKLSERGRALVDGRGAERVAFCLLAACMTLRRATLEDGEQLHAWRNHPDIRAMSGLSEPISLASHMDWLAGKLAAENCRLYVTEIGSTAIGSIRFDRMKDGALEVSLYLDPDLPGLGLGPHLLLAGERDVMVDWPGDATFTASVLPDNVVSARLFVSCGYSGAPPRYNKHVAQRKSVS